MCNSFLLLIQGGRYMALPSPIEKLEEVQQTRFSWKLLKRSKSFPFIPTGILLVVLASALLTKTRVKWKRDEDATFGCLCAINVIFIEQNILRAAETTKKTQRKSIRRDSKINSPNIYFLGRNLGNQRRGWLNDSSGRMKKLFSSSLRKHLQLCTLNDESAIKAKWFIRASLLFLADISHKRKKKSNMLRQHVALQKIETVFISLSLPNKDAHKFTLEFP